MKKSFDIVRQAKILNVAVALVMCGMGILLFFPLFTVSVEKIMIGILCLIVGGAKLVGFFSNDMYRLAFQYDLATGLFALILGTLFLASPEEFDRALPTTVGAFAILESVTKFQIGLDARRFGMALWRSMLASSVVLCAAGILTVISFYSKELHEAVMLPLALVAIGAENAWFTAYTVRVRSRRKKKMREWLEDGDLESEH